MLENPFTQLPGEIIGEILSLAVGRIELQLPHHDDDYPKCNPWDLSQVCKDWRDAINSTPYIWSNIFLSISPNEATAGHKYDALLLALKLCLGRSCNCSLTIKLRISESTPSDQVLLFFKLLMEYAQQWETVLICASLLPYLSNSPVQYTCLRRLSILSWDPTEENYVGLFQDAPLLSCISLINLPYHGQRLGVVGIPWSRISHLKVYVRSGVLDDLIDILKNTSNLISLEYSISHYYTSQEGLPILKLPHLERLDWSSVGGRSRYDSTSGQTFTSQFFDLLKAPQLTVLKVRGICCDRDVEAICSCLQRSGCSITSLDLPTSLAFSLFSLIPDVRTLELHEPIDFNVESFDTGPRCGFELAHLQKVVYNCSRAATAHHGISQFFGYLNAPKLSVLIVDNHVYSRRGVKAIHNCLQRSGCSIKSLELPSAYYILPLRSLAPDLETLVLPRDLKYDDEHSMSLLRELTFDHSADSWLFPKLKKIELYCSAISIPIFEAFVDMLKSRLWAPPDSLVSLQCDGLRELQFSNSPLSMEMTHLIQERLTPQESLRIIYVEAFRYPDRWDFG